MTVWTRHQSYRGNTGISLLFCLAPCPKLDRTSLEEEDMYLRNATAKYRTSAVLLLLVEGACNPFLYLLAWRTQRFPLTAYDQKVGYWTSLNKFLSDANKWGLMNHIFKKWCCKPLWYMCVYRERFSKAPKWERKCRWVGRSTVNFSDRWLLRQSALNDKWLYIKTYTPQINTKKCLQETFELKFNDCTKLLANQEIQAVKKKKGST